LRAFAAARDWDQFHSPKNLAVAVSVEAGELLEHFQWIAESALLPPDSADKIERRWRTSSSTLFDSLTSWISTC
jgi:hypothetical protein